MKKTRWKFFAAGILAAMFAVFFIMPQSKSTAGLSGDWKSRAIRVAFCRNMPPYQFVDANGNSVGMHIDVLNRIAEKQKLNIEYIPLETKSACFEALDNGQADIILGANITTQYSSYLTWCTNELSSSEVCLITSKKVSNQYGDNVPYMKYIVVSEYGISNNFITSSPNCSMGIVVGDPMRAFELLKSAKAQMIIGDKNSMLYQIYKSSLTDEYIIVHNYLGAVSYTIVVQNGNKELLRCLDVGLANVRSDGSYEKLADKWFINEQEHRIGKILKKISVIALIVFCFGLVYLFISARTKKLLERKVNEQSGEIINVNRKLAQRLKTINQRNELLNSLIEKSPVSIILFEQNHNISLMNTSARLLAGDNVNRQERYKIDDIPIFADILRINSANPFKLGYEMKGREFELEIQGQKRNYDCSLFQLITNGEVNAVLMWVNDITEEIRERNELWENKKHSVLNRMIAGIAHEIKNPITAISTFTSLIKTKGASSRFLSAFEQFVPAEVERINHLIENLLDYARPPHMNIQKISVREICEGCAMMLSATAAKSNIEIDYSDIEDALIMASSDHLKQMLINIMMNGIESMQAKLEKGCNDKLTLKISCAAEQDKVFIRIHDEGEGMSREQLEMSTEPFYTTKAKSSGLGLALTSQFAKQNGATMAIASQEGCYTQIEFCFKKYMGTEERTET